jgi:hypothetical protein
VVELLAAWCLSECKINVVCFGAIIILWLHLLYGLFILISFLYRVHNVDQFHHTSVVVSLMIFFMFRWVLFIWVLC